jgi:hypothetical protein
MLIGNVLRGDRGPRAPPNRPIRPESGLSDCVFRTIHQNSLTDCDCDSQSVSDRFSNDTPGFSEADDHHGPFPFQISSQPTKWLPSK